MKRRLTIICLALLSVCCVPDDAEYAAVNELGYAFLSESGSLVRDNGSFAVPAGGGTISVKILSNGDVSVSPRGGVPQWLSLDGALSFKGDGIISATMEANGGFRRALVLDVSRKGADPISVVLRQEGTPVLLDCASPYLSAAGSSASQVSFAVSTNIAPEELSKEIFYASGAKDWILESSLGSDGSLALSIPANSGSSSRKARINLSFTDGWELSHSLDLYLTQASGSDSFGQPISFRQLRSLTPGPVSEDYTLSGIVVSDYRSPNMEANPLLTADEAGDFRNSSVSKAVFSSVMQAVDTTASVRTAYLESEDGALGVRLVFAEPSENRLAFGTKLTLSLEGATLIREEEPERWTLSGITAQQLLQSTPGGGVPAKERSIGALTDEDVYTFVSISGVEFPVKDGSYTDIRENHALHSTVNDNTVSATDSKRYFYMDGYANLLTDAEGRAICVPINMLCTWRKPAEGIPQGSGSASGILVHNDIPRYGDAGRYQLRVLDKSGFSALQDASQWTTLASWDNGTVNPTSGTAALSCTKTGAVLANEHSYKSLTAATKRTCGISDTHRSLKVSSAVSGWYNFAGDGSVDSYNALVAELSTEGLSGSTGLMVAFRFYAGCSGTPSTFQAFPSHWCADYSIDGGQSFVAASNADLSGKDYVHLRSIATYTLQWGSFKIPTSAYSGIGPSCHAFMLPPECLGQSSLMVRIRPYDTVLSVMPTLFTDEVEVSHTTSATSVSDYVSFQDIIISYR